MSSAILLRTRLSKPGEKARRGSQPRGIPSPRRKLCLRRQSAHGLCALRRVPGALTRGDASVTVAISMYKAVNKVTPSKGAAGISTLVIRGQPAAALQGRRHRGAHPEPLQRRPHHPGWTVAFPGLVTPLPAMDRVHGLSLYRAPGLLLRRHVVTLPAKIWGEEVQDTYKRRRQATEKRDDPS